MKLAVERTKETLASNGGLAVVGSLTKSLKTGRELDETKFSNCGPDISNKDVFRSYLGLPAMGRTNYEDMELFRMDSGNDSSENIAEFKKKKNNFFIVKRNLRKESLGEWLEIAMENGGMEEPRKGKKVWPGEIFRNVEGYGATRIVFKAIERTSDGSGTAFLLPQIEVETYWTNLSGKPESIIELYRGHGTSEQFHGELKSDMGVERLPSGKFLTNSLILKSAMPAFNLPRKIGCDLLSFPEDLPVKLDVTRRRIGSVMRNIVGVAGKLTRSGGCMQLKIGVSCPWLNPFKRLFASYC